jgi:hypothetical protein
MKSLIWKECRENVMWAFLAMLLAGGFMFITLHEHPPNSIMQQGFYVGTTVGGALFGAILGFLQVIFEARGDKRALLLHRPLSHSQIFLAKTIAGLGLYLLALGLPFAGAVAWVAAPGHIAAPFRWQMVLPGLADILTGVAYYFAGMLTAQREARWYGSRGLGLVAAVLCSLCVNLLPEFQHALLAILILGTLLAVAAWGSFISGGAYGPQPRIAKVALGVSFLVGLLVVSMAAQLVVGAWFETGARDWQQLDRQGRVLVVHSQEGEATVTDLQGNEMPEFKGKLLDWHAIKEYEAPTTMLGRGPEIHWYRFPDRLFLPMPSVSAHGERWFYVPDEARLVGYNKDTRRCIGSFGPDGFVPADQHSTERFKGALQYRCGYFFAGLAAPDFLPFSEGVYAVDFKQRTLQPLFTPAQGQTVVSAALRSDDQKLPSTVPLANGGSGGLTFVLTDDAVRGVDRAGAPVFSAPLAYDSKNYYLQTGWLENGRFVVWYHPIANWESTPIGVGKITILVLSNFAFQYLPALWDQSECKPSYLVEYEVGGEGIKELKRREVPPGPVAEPAQGQALYGLVTPPAGVVLYSGAYQYYVSPAGGWTVGLESGVARGFVALMLLSAAVCALMCFLLARRYSFFRARSVGWSLCGLLWGPAGLLLMLALQDWPARITCPGCRKLRLVTRDTCEHCGAAHAAPAPDGTEIFEEAAKELQLN